MVEVVVALVEEVEGLVVEDVLDEDWAPLVDVVVLVPVVLEVEVKLD